MTKLDVYLSAHRAAEQFIDCKSELAMRGQTLALYTRDVANDEDFQEWQSLFDDRLALMRRLREQKSAGHIAWEKREAEKPKTEKHKAEAGGK